MKIQKTRLVYSPQLQQILLVSWFICYILLILISSDPDLDTSDVTGPANDGADKRKLIYCLPEGAEENANAEPVYLSSVLYTDFTSMNWPVPGKFHLLSADI